MENDQNLIRRLEEEEETNSFNQSKRKRGEEEEAKNSPFLVLSTTPSKPVARKSEQIQARNGS
jgi:hypothetical protein